ncbi:MAG: type II toxin-antitoxin system CcdA family antitoxin [Erythrobacter sp.]
MTTPTENRQPENLVSDWREANREAILSANAWVEANGLPLRDYRLF